MFFMACVCHAFASVHCCPVVTCLERADLLALVCVFVTFPCGTLGQVWYLIESIHDLCHLQTLLILFIHGRIQKGTEVPDHPSLENHKLLLCFLRNTGPDPNRSKGVQFLLVGGLYVTLVYTLMTKIAFA